LEREDHRHVILVSGRWGRWSGGNRRSFRGDGGMVAGP
jgi:hypothetical protein